MLVSEYPGQRREYVALPPAPDVAAQAERRLRSHSYLALKNVSCEYCDGVLTLRGCLPTYYLKQVAQAAVGQLDGVRRVINDIEVTSSGRRFVCPSLKARRNNRMLPLLVLTAVLAAEVPSRLAVIRAAPDFSLTTQDGGTLSLADLRGRVALVSFIFTTCNGTCPATTHRMGRIQQALAARGLTRDGQVRLLSITLDPARDTPAVLADYARLYDADTASWTFLTGPRERVEKAIAAWGMWARPAANGQLDHPLRVFLVDTRGRVREIYNLDFLKAEWVVEDVELLLREGAAR